MRQIAFALALATTSLATLATANCQAEESLDFFAEHLLEVPMDFRYLSLPQVPLDRTTAEFRLVGGGSQVSSGPLRADLPMFGLQLYTPIGEKRAFSVALFYDAYRFSGDNSSAVVEPTFTSLVGQPDQFAANVTGVEGDGFHTGVSASYIWLRESGANLHLGVVLETLNVQQLAVRFTTTELTTNYSGSLDYGGTYNAITPYLKYECAPQRFKGEWVGKLSLTFANPLPRVGFEGEISGPGFVQAGDSAAAGQGTHIPDTYFGVGYSLEKKSSGWRFEVGGLLYSLLFEPTIHSGVDSPILVSLSKSLWRGGGH